MIHRRQPAPIRPRGLVPAVAMRAQAAASLGAPIASVLLGIVRDAWQYTTALRRAGGAR